MHAIVVKFPEKKENPSIPCGYCNTLLKPSDQICPNCGASRTKIIEEFDRAYEKWTTEEDKALTERYKGGLSISQLAKEHQRKLGAIHSRLRKLGLVTEEGLSQTGA